MNRTAPPTLGVLSEGLYSTGTEILNSIPENSSVVDGGSALSGAASSSAIRPGDDDTIRRKNAGSDLSTGAAVGGASSHELSGGRETAGSSFKKALITRRVILVSLTICVLLGAVTIGVVVALMTDYDKEGSSIEKESSLMADEDVESSTGTTTTGGAEVSRNDPPTAPVTLPPAEFDQSVFETDWEEEDINEFDEAIFEISIGATAQIEAVAMADAAEARPAFSTTTTPQAQCRRWFLDSPYHVDLTVSNVGKLRVQQRYILCVLYHSTGGDYWTLDSEGDWNYEYMRVGAATHYFDDSQHECDWLGVRCRPLGHNAKGIEADLLLVHALRLHDANLTGTLPPEISYLNHMRLLQISSNPNLTGIIPSNLLDEMPRLRALALANNSLTGPIPYRSSAFQPDRGEIPLTLFWLENNLLTGTIPTELTFLKQLQLLKLSWNELAGTIPANLISDLPQLVNLDLSGNSLSGPLPNKASSWSMLRELSLYDNALTGRIPFYGPQLLRLDLHQNVLTHYPSHTYSQQGTSLVDIVLYDNVLVGSLSDTYPWKTSNLAYFDVARNQFTGEIPHKLWHLPNLLHLQLDFNEFEGFLPFSTKLSEFDYEDYIDDEYHRKRGRIMIDAGDDDDDDDDDKDDKQPVQSFVSVWLDSNKLFGEIPPNFGVGWFNLTSLKLQNNDLVGTISDAQCEAWPNLVQFVTDCDDGQVTCSCCTRCSSC